MPTLIFVHGACVRDAPWWWSRMTEQLASHGIASVAVPLPSCGETEDGLGDLYADVEANRRAIDEAEAPVVLCGFLSQPEAFAHRIAAEIESVA